MIVGVIDRHDLLIASQSVAYQLRVGVSFGFIRLGWLTKSPINNCTRQVLRFTMHKIIIFLLFPLLIGSESLNNQFLIALKKNFSFLLLLDMTSDTYPLIMGHYLLYLKVASATFNFCFELITLINGLR